MYTDSLFTQMEIIQAKHKVALDSFNVAGYNLNSLKTGLAIHEFGFSSEYNVSVDFYIKIINYSKKVIKYVWITVNAYNRVDDFIGSKTVQLVGPFENGASGKATFENMFYNRVFDYGKITKIKIQYKDGSIKELSGKL